MKITIGKFSKIYLTIVLLCVKAFGPQLLAQYPNSPDFRYGKLKNGFTYYINKTPEPQIFLQLVIRAGFANEAKDQQGLAHLLEHVIAMNGTSSFDKGINGFIQKAGTAISAGASTALNYTSYHIGIPSNNSALKERAFRFLREIANDSLITEKLRDNSVVDNERNTVLQEYNMHNLQEAYKTFRVLGVEEGHRLYDPAITEIQHNKHIKTFDPESLQRFYKTWYTPAHQCIIISGNMDIDAAEKNIDKYFGSIAAQSPAYNYDAAQHLNASKVNLNDGNQVINIASNNDRITVEYIIKRKAGSIADIINARKRFSEKIYAELYNKMMGQRLLYITRKYDAPLESISSIMEAYRPLEAGINVLQTNFTLASEASLRSAISEVLTEIHRVRTFGFLQPELEQAKKAVSFDYLETLHSNSSLTQQATNHFVFGGPLPQEIVNRKQGEYLLKNITLREINSYLKQWLSYSKNSDLVILAPKHYDTISVEDFDRLARGISAQSIKPYTIHKPLSSIIDTNIAKSFRSNVKFSTKELDAIEATEYTLDNGIKLILKPLPAHNGESQITIHGFSKNGADLYQQPYLKKLSLGDIIDHSGIYKYDKFELLDFKQSYNLQLHVSLMNNTAEIQASGPSKNTEQVLQLIYLQLLYPNKNRPAFNDWMQKQKAKIKNNQVNTVVTAFDTISRLTGLSAQMDMNDLNDINFDSIYKIYHQSFSNTGDFTFVISGNFEKQKIQPLLLKYFGSMPSVKLSLRTLQTASPDTMIKRNYSRYFNVNSNEKDLPVMISYVGRYPADQKSRIKFEVLSRLLNYIMFNRISGKEGTYGCSAGATFMQGNYYVNIQFKSDSILAQKRIDAVTEEINLLKSDGPDLAHFNAIVSTLKENYLNSLSSGDFWCQYLKTQYVEGADLSEVCNRIAIFDQVTPGDIQELAKTILVDENRLQFTFSSFLADTPNEKH